MKHTYTDTIRRVYPEDGDGASLEVKPYPDAPDTALVIDISRDETSKEWFGSDIRNCSMSPGFARALGLCLIRAADEMENKK